MACLLAVGVHKVLHSNGITDGEVVGAVEDTVNASSLVTESAGRWAVDSDDGSPVGITALGGSDGLAAKAWKLNISAVVGSSITTISTRFWAGIHGGFLHISAESSAGSGGGGVAVEWTLDIKIWSWISTSGNWSVESIT